MKGNDAANTLLVCLKQGSPFPAKKWALPPGPLEPPGIDSVSLNDEGAICRVELLQTFRGFNRMMLMLLVFPNGNLGWLLGKFCADFTHIPRHPKEIFGGGHAHAPLLVSTAVEGKILEGEFVRLGCLEKSKREISEIRDCCSSVRVSSTEWVEMSSNLHKDVEDKGPSGARDIPFKGMCKRERS